jgi:ferredoxin
VIKVAAGCRSGRCGICRVQILDGAYAVRPATAPGRDPPGSADPGFALACRLVPESDIHLRPAAPPPQGSGT